MVKFQRAEIHSAYACNSGQRLAVVQHLLRCEGREALDGTDSVELDFPVTDAAAVVTTRQVVRLVFSDGSFTEWRVRAVRDQNGESGAVKTVTAFTPLQDMADAGAISELSLAGMPQFEIGLSKVSVTEVINTYVLPKLADAGYGYFTLGTVEPTELYDVLLKKMTPLAALRYLCDLAREDTTKRPAELRIRRNGTTGYLIDVLRSIGSTATTADLRYRKNLRKTDLTTDSERQATVIQPFGADLPDGTPSGIARVAFRLGTPTGLVYPITDPEGYASPILFEDQLTGYFVAPDADNPLVEITSSSPGTPATVTLASSTGITAGKVYELRADADGTFLSEMPSSTTITDRKVQAIDRADLLGVRNLPGNGWFRLWPNPALEPTDWTYYALGAYSAFTPFAQNTDPLWTQFGGKSVKLFVAGTTGNTWGLRSPVFYPRSQEGLQLHCVKVRIIFRVFRGAASVVVALRDGVTLEVIKQLTLVPEDNPVPAAGPTGTPTVGSWVDVSIINVDLIDYNVSGVIVDVIASAGVGSAIDGVIESYVDAVQVTQTVGESPEGFVEYSGSNALWREGNRVLATFTDPPEHYEIDVDDLTRFDGTQFPFDQLTLGADVRLTDRSLAVNGELLRLVEKSLIDYLTPKRTQIKVASRWEQFVELSFPGGSRPGVAPTPSVSTTLPPGVPPGPGTGPRGDGVITMRAGPPLVLEGVPATLTEPADAATDRLWLNVRDTASMILQGGSGRAASAGTRMSLMYSLTGEGGTFVALGPQMALDAVRYPSVGDGTALAADARAADRICMSWGLEGGDGETTVEVGNIYVSPAVFAAPEPPDDDLPEGGPLGAIIWHVDAQSPELAAEVLTDEFDQTYINTWPDLAPQNLDALDTGETISPDYYAARLNGFPAIGTDAPKGLVVSRLPTNDSFTLYSVGAFFEDGIIVAIQGPGGWYTAVEALDRLGAAVWNTAFDPNGIKTVDAFAPDGLGGDVFVPRIVRLTFDRIVGTFALHVDSELRDATVLVSGLPTASGLSNNTIGAFQQLLELSFKMYLTGRAYHGEHVMWDAPHSAASAEVIEAQLRTKWGIT